jgi:hypothetical protein
LVAIFFIYENLAAGVQKPTSRFPSYQTILLRAVAALLPLGHDDFSPLARSGFVRRTKTEATSSGGRLLRTSTKGT